MLRTGHKNCHRDARLLRWLHTTPSVCLTLKQKHLPPNSSPIATPTFSPGLTARSAPRKTPQDVRKNGVPRSEINPERHVKRNELGVQLLSRKLHEQVFKNITFPRPDAAYINIAREHIKGHGLDPTQGSVLPDIGFDLPPLQGSNLLEHFYRIGAQSAQPWLNLTKEFSASELPPKPEIWDIRSGWTKYGHAADGSSEIVPYPVHNGNPEEILVFDVETMPPYHPYAIIACAASPNAWYVWISPWLLGETEDPQQLVPLGSQETSRVVVGHNVAYDRARILEEYAVEASQTRFVDTMALHVAVSGISSHQRPAWNKYRKSKLAREQQDASEAAPEPSPNPEIQQDGADEILRNELRRIKRDMAQSFPLLNEGVVGDLETAEAELSSKRWEELTSANSLADVARLHCGIKVDKTIRDDFMKLPPEKIRDNIMDYIGYCASDVEVTHQVFCKVLPSFLTSCPHPVSFAGMLTMGSSFLPVNQEWEKYLARAEGTYRTMEDRVILKLKELAEEARSMMVLEGESEDPRPPRWKDDVWLSQLDWTPKAAGKSRGVCPPEVDSAPSPAVSSDEHLVPVWYSSTLRDPLGKTILERILPLILRLRYDGHPMQYSPKERWHMLVDGQICRLESAGSTKTSAILSRKHSLSPLQTGRMTADDVDLALAISQGDKGPEVEDRVRALAKQVYESTSAEHAGADPWLKQLDWNLVLDNGTAEAKRPKEAKAKAAKPPPTYWPKWYWEATKPKKGVPPGTLDVTVRSRIAPLLLKLSWLGWPLFYSREHGWTFRVPADVGFTTRAVALKFFDPVDDALADMCLRGGFVFYKLPHKDGDEANVGSPLGKTFIKFAQDGTLRSPGDEAKEALDMNAQCSYWISARDRIMNQMVVWQKSGLDLGFSGELTSTPASANGEEKKWGIILPHVITMGTVTRRAIEKTWLTASNAKANRVGSELKAMVRAPEGYAIVGADVDSEELWISSCMGDAQFGLHGATALGWMTLEGTKKAGTDLHSKTASILGISRDQAKVFNYSRIYGAGMRHAMLLLLQSNAGMLPEQAQKLAENLYASTKGKNTHRTDVFGRKFWFGGTESYVFNKLEEIALSDRPQTPALGCGVTYALSKEHLPTDFGSDYMPSRINWVVQSSGVDYLHLLIVSMDHLIRKYDIDARYLISVHDELRYLVKDHDRYRAALALQIANLWTRSMFACKLGMDDLPQSVAFFSAVDVDRVLRKEVDMPCVTPSQPTPIPSGESLDIAKVLEKTNGGSLLKDGLPTNSTLHSSASLLPADDLHGYTEPNCLTHRSPHAAFLQAQSTADFEEIKHLARMVTKQAFKGGIGGGSRKRGKGRAAPIGDGRSVDYLAEMAAEEELTRSALCDRLLA